MSFRARLTLFFLLIVIVPMVSVAVILFRLIADNEQGKADARVAQGQTAAIGLYKREAGRARVVARRIGSDQEFVRALAAGDTAAAQARASQLRTLTRAAWIAFERGGRAVVEVGSRDTVASVAGNVRDSSGVVGRLHVSVVTAPAFARLTREVTGLDAAVQRAGRTIASTLPGLGDQRLARVGDIEVDGNDYRVATFSTPGERRARVAVLYDREETANEIAAGRTITAVILIGFLVLAFAFALAVSRSLQAQIGSFLAGARRLAGGDFSTPVPTEGKDEFAALGQEFNAMAGQLEARLEELRQERARLQESIRRIGETFASNLDRDALLEIVVRTAVDAVGGGAGRASTRERPGGPLEQRTSAGVPRELGEIVRSVEARALETGAPAAVDQDGRAGLAHPLKPGDGEVLGLVSVARAGPPFDEGERRLFNYLAAQATVSIENVDLHELVQRQAVTDELTGLFNHRRFQEVITGEVERARRYDQPLGLVMLDIDDFKQVNDTYGHQQGDVVLREVAGVLRAGSREIDEPARYGGEELAVALPQTDLEGTFLLAERVRSEVEALRIPRLDGDGVLRVTASLGVAALPDSAEDKDGLISAADAALYSAKRAGKNRTERALAAATRTAPAK